MIKIQDLKPGDLIRPDHKMSGIDQVILVVALQPEQGIIWWMRLWSDHREPLNQVKKWRPGGEIRWHRARKVPSP
jgi:hypothetical protein